jgi:hypothetical protein
MKLPIVSLTVGACLLLSSASVVFAVDIHNGPVGPGTTGRSGTNGSGAASCGAAGTTMGSTQAGPPGQVNHSNSVNSPFPTQGDPSPNKQYAGTAGAGNSLNAGGAPASQYDVACFQHQVP